MFELNEPIVISLIMTAFIASSHILFSLKNKLSVDNTTTNMNTKPLKMVVFDLDETLGSFVEIGIFWEALERYYGHNLLDERFFEVFDIFPDFLRPKILTILEYLKDKKERKVCDQIMIYTNNQGPKYWVKMISNYLNHKLGYKLFDRIIAAFKVKGKIVEIGRTSHNKSVEDLIRCTRIPMNTEICFIDDQKHPLMAQDNVYYINVKPYEYSLPYDIMALMYYNKFNDEIEDTKEEFVNAIVSYMKRYNYTINTKTDIEYNADVVISKQILIHLEDFFRNGRSQNTRKRRKIKKQGTKKISLKDL